MVREAFRNYDIRGVYGKDFLDEDAFFVGKAFGSYLIRNGAKNCAVGHDNRQSSPVLYKRYCEGLLSTGIHVVELGECLTPLVKFYVCEKGLDAGTSVTASHNAAEYNGFKFTLKSAHPYFGEQIADLYNDTINKNFEVGEGRTSKGNDLLDLYKTFLSNKFDFRDRSLKVALNCGNGTASNFAPKILRDLGVEVVEINCVSDGSFPNGAPDPEDAGFMQALKDKVVQERCQMGFGLDGDSDRFGLMDEDGVRYESDKVMMVISAYLLSQNPGGLICCDVKCSSFLSNLIDSLGGECRFIRTGYPYHALEVQNGALLSGEFSGHFYFGKSLGFYGIDDAIVSACIMLKVLMESREDKFSNLVGGFPRLPHTSEVKIDCADKVKFTVIDRVVEEAKKLTGLHDVLIIDGFRASISDTGWFLIRASNTSHCISVRVEGAGKEEVEEIKQLTTKLLVSAGMKTDMILKAPVYFS
jgi:phosphomannomutase / phosphoglucomutase